MYSGYSGQVKYYCVLYEQLILIERSPKVYCRKLPYEKTACVYKTTYDYKDTNTK